MLTNNSIKKITQHVHTLCIQWQDDDKSTYHYIWLRDNDQRTQISIGQQSNDTFNIPLTIQPVDISIGNDLKILWSDQHISHIDFAWLRKNSYSSLQKGMKHLAPKLWLSDHFTQESMHFSYPSLCNDNVIMREMLQHLQDYGFAVLDRVPVKNAMVMEVLKLFGYPIETHHNKMWEIKVISNSEDLGDTNKTLPGHIDQPYRHSAPTMTLLHVLSNNTSGGESTLVDGFALAEALRKDHPAAFKLLSSTPVTYRYHDEQTVLQHESTIIQLNARDEVVQVRMNPFSIQPFYTAPEHMLDFYAAYQTLGQMMESDTYKLTMKLAAGHLLIMDNTRILHGRLGYDSAEGERLLQGCFSKQEDFWSKLAVLKRSS